MISASLKWDDSLSIPERTHAPAPVGLSRKILYPVITGNFGFVFVQAIRREVPGLVSLPFTIDLVANPISTPIRFGMRNLPLAAVDIQIVWAKIIWCMAAVRRTHRWVAVAQVP